VELPVRHKGSRGKARHPMGWSCWSAADERAAVGLGPQLCCFLKRRQGEKLPRMPPRPVLEHSWKSLSSAPCRFCLVPE